MSATGQRPALRLIESDEGLLVEGWRCPECAYVTAAARPWCPRCRHALEAASFGPYGRVWASTMVYIDVPGHPAPYGLVYVDLDGGPRVLAHSDAGHPLPVGSVVRNAGTTANEDIRVEPAPSTRATDERTA